MAARKRAKLTEAEWSRVFDLRCRTKRGERISDEEHILCVDAHKEDESRYGAMSRTVFDATKPIGSVR